MSAQVALVVSGGVCSSPSQLADNRCSDVGLIEEYAAQANTELSPAQAELQIAED